MRTQFAQLLVIEQRIAAHIAHVQQLINTLPF